VLTGVPPCRPCKFKRICRCPKKVDEIDEHPDIGKRWVIYGYIDIICPYINSNRSKPQKTHENNKINTIRMFNIEENIMKDP